MRPLRRGALLILAAMLVALAGVACGGDDSGSGTGEAAEGSLAQEYDFSGSTFTVGSKEFTEQLILGNMTKLALEATGADVEDQLGLEGSVVVRRALTSGRIDMYWEYTGTGWITHLGEVEPIPNSAEQYEAVAARDLQENDIRWLAPAPFNNTYAIAVRSEAAEDLGVTKISDLTRLTRERPDEATICVGSEFATRDDGLPGVEAKYGFTLPDDNISVVQDAVVYNQVDQGEPCNFGSVFSTDGRIAALDLTLLTDDQSFFPKFNPALNVRRQVLEQNPELADLAKDLADSLDERTMTELNAKVDVDGELPEDVAEQFLRDKGFIG